MCNGGIFLFRLIQLKKIGETAQHVEAHGMAAEAQIYVANAFAVAGSTLEADSVQNLTTALGTGVPVTSLRGLRPMALILGNEERGLDPATLALCDAVVTSTNHETWPSQ